MGGSSLRDATSVLYPCCVIVLKKRRDGTKKEEARKG